MEGHLSVRAHGTVLLASAYHRWSVSKSSQGLHPLSVGFLAQGTCLILETSLDNFNQLFEEACRIVVLQMDNKECARKITLENAQNREYEHICSRRHDSRQLMRCCRRPRSPRCHHAPPGRRRVPRGSGKHASRDSAALFYCFRNAQSRLDHRDQYGARDQSPAEHRLDLQNQQFGEQTSGRGS